jgi:hypothetical protein
LKIMKPFACLASLLAVALGLVVAARADEFSLSYTFRGGEDSAGYGTTVAATFDGTLSGNLITDITDVSVYANGASMDPIDVVSSYNGANGAVVSVDGTQNSFYFQNATVDYFASVTGEAAIQIDGGYSQTDLSDAGAFAYNEDLPGDGDALNSSWTVTDLSSSSVPDGGATVAMLGTALIGLAGLRRKLALSGSPPSV